MVLLDLVSSKMDSYLARQSPLKVLGICLGSIFVVGVLDYVTGYNVSFTIFYVIPIFIAAWYLHLGDAVFISIISYAVMAIADYLAGMKYTLHPLTHIWNEFIRLIFFLMVAYLISEIRQQLIREKLLSRIDHLTQIPNRRAFYEALENEILRTRRQPHPITVAYFDIDRFKQVNDRYGHRVGDEVLRRVADIIRTGLRGTDTVARLGGDEFAAVLSHSGRQISDIVIQKIRSNLLTLAESYRWPIGFSVGCVTFTHPPANVEDIVHRADQLMYDCKKEGGTFVHHEIDDDAAVLEFSRQ